VTSYRQARVNSLLHRAAHRRNAELSRKPDHNFRDGRQDMNMLVTVEMRRPDASANYFFDLRPQLELSVRQADSPGGNSRPQARRRHMKSASSVNQRSNLSRIGHGRPVGEIEVHSDTESIESLACPCGGLKRNSICH